MRPTGQAITRFLVVILFAQGEETPGDPLNELCPVATWSWQIKPI